MTQSDRRRIKWGFSTNAVTERPKTLAEAQERLLVSDEPPQMNDVIIAEVVELGRHTKIELPTKRAAALFVGDLVGVAYGYRYATRQFEGVIPPSNGPCHMLSVGGVCGEVVGMPFDMEPPTILRPIGYLRGADGKRVNLERLGIVGSEPPFGAAKVILVVGASMDSGKTTAAYSIVHGLTRAGAVVAAGKVTGTASAKDPLIMEDAGAVKILDFTDAGFVSTAQCSSAQLWRILTAIGTHLAHTNPDYIVLEIADGIVQRETQLLLGLLREKGCIDFTVYTCNDSLGVASGVNTLRKLDFNVVAVSGSVAYSPLAAREAQAQTDLPVLLREQLQDPAVEQLFVKRDAEGRTNALKDLILKFPTTPKPLGRTASSL
jgi:hypothetical protein